MSGDYSENMNYWIDFYSNDHQKDLSIEAELISYGHIVTKFGMDVVNEDPEFKVLVVLDDEDVAYELSKEEKRRVVEILNNLYWNETLY